MGARLTHEMFMEKVYKRFPNDILLPVDKYKNKRSIVRLKHEKCGNIVSRDGGNWMYTALTPCPYCYDPNNSTLENLKKKLKNHNKNIVYIGNFGHGDTLIKLKCLNCDYIFEKTLYNINRCIKRNGKICNKCTGVHNYSTSEFNKMINKSTNNEYSLGSEYINTNNKVEVLHSKCQKTTQVLPKIAILGKCCDHCYRKNSTFPERVILDFLKERKIEFSCEKTFDNLLGLGGKN